jgi:hypothetical protein
MLRLAFLIGLACFCLGGGVADAAKLAPLAEAKPIGGAAVYFNPDKVFAVYQGPLVTVTTVANPLAAEYQTGSATTYVAGMREEPSPIDEDPTKFLNGLSLGLLFVHLHTDDGDLYLRATAVRWISAPTGPGIRPGAKAFVFAGLTTPGGIRIPFQVKETPDQVKSLVDAVRVRLNAAE